MRNSIQQLIHDRSTIMDGNPETSEIPGSPVDLKMHIHAHGMREGPFRLAPAGTLGATRLDGN